MCHHRDRLDLLVQARALLARADEFEVGGPATQPPVSAARYLKAQCEMAASIPLYLIQLFEMGALLLCSLADG